MQKDPEMQGRMYLLMAMLLSGSAILPADAMADDDDVGVSTYSVKLNNDDRLSLKKARKISGADVWLSGQLLVPDDEMDDVELFVEVENGNCHYARIRKNGRFDLLIPGGAVARLIYRKPDHISKEIVIDLSDLDGPSIGDKERKVEFDVVLLHSKEFPDAAYDGPVGSIDMMRDPRLIKVTHHKRLIAMY
jgi:hypothetical protein